MTADEKKKQLDEKPKQVTMTSAKDIELVKTETEPKLDESRYQADSLYGCIVLFSSFLIYTIANGVHYSWGVYHTHFLEEGVGDNVQLAAIGTTIGAMKLFNGVWIGNFAMRFGFQRTVALGGFIIATGQFAASFCSNVSLGDFCHLSLITPRYTFSS
jgi:hypothetical protein